MLIFGLLVFTMRGPWSPRAAKRDFEEHERLVKEELEKIPRTPPRAIAACSRSPRAHQVSGGLGLSSQLDSFPWRFDGIEPSFGPAEMAISLDREVV